MEWTVLTTSAFYAGIISTATPLALGALGGVITERSGVVNIGIEGMMLIGAFFGAWIGTGAGPWVGLLAALLSGALIALLHGVVAITFRADQIVSGVAINLFGTGLTGFLYETYTPNGFVSLQTLPNVRIPGIDNIPFVGDIVADQNILVYITLVLLLGAQFLLFNTTLGLRIRAVGEQPRAADTVGINVFALRYLCVTLSGALAGLGGAYLSLGLLGNFGVGMTAGRGFIALAAMIVGKYTPWGACAACLLFGLGQQIQTSGLVPQPSFAGNAVAIAPYVITLIAVAGFIGRAIPPAADGQPYDPAK